MYWREPYRQVLCGWTWVRNAWHCFMFRGALELGPKTSAGCISTHFATEWHHTGSWKPAPVVGVLTPHVLVKLQIRVLPQLLWGLSHETFPSLPPSKCLTQWEWSGVRPKANTLLHLSPERKGCWVRHTPWKSSLLIYTREVGSWAVIRFKWGHGAGPHGGIRVLG